MRNTIMHFYTSLSSPEQKTLLARYIYGAANEVIRSDFFGTLPQNHRDALTGADEQARIETAIRYARKAGRKLCVPDEATGSIRVNNRDSFKNCFAVFILDGILRSDDLPERVNLVFQRGGAAAQTYGTIVSEMNGLLGREVLAAPAPRQPQSVPGAYMPQNEPGDAYLPQQTAGNAPVPPAINPQPAVQKKKTNILIPILAVVLVLLLVVGGVALMVHLVHRQDTDTPAEEIAAAENSADVYDAASDSSVAEMQPPAVQILQEYEFDGTHDFVAGKAWVSYKSRDNNNYERTYRAVINTSGKLKYDPVKLECDNKDHEKINNSVYTFKAQTNGYVLICDHKAVTPEGKVVDANNLPDDVLAELKGANDGLIEKHDSDTEKAWYEDIRGTVVLDKAKLTDKSVVED